MWLPRPKIFDDLDNDPEISHVHFDLVTITLTPVKSLNEVEVC